MFHKILILNMFFMAITLGGCNGDKDTNEAAHQTEKNSALSLTVYTARKEHLIKPLFDLYTKKTGVNIQYITDKAGPLLTRLATEGKATPADLLITVDAGNLWQASEKELLQPVKSTVLETNIPSHLRDTNNRWFGLSVRARTIVYSTDRITPDELSTYEDLAAEKWRGKLCLRTAKKVYNQSLVASMMDQLGESETEKVITGWVNNLATDVFSDDTAVMKAILAGQCDVGIVNSYYFGRLKKKEPNAAIALFWPNQDDRGVHINISGAGVTRYSKHPEEAVKLLEWLSSEEAQQLFADINLEYPMDSNVAVSNEVARWGAFKQDTINVEILGQRQTDAIKLMDRAGYR